MSDDDARAQHGEHRWINVTTLGDLIGQRAEAHPEREALVIGTDRRTYGELDELSDHYARGLVALGVGQGDRVGYFFHECVHSVGVLLGAAKIGAVTVPLNARFKSYELSQVVVHSGMKVLLTTRPPAGADFVELLNETLPELASATAGSLSLVDAPELAAVVVLSEDGAPGFVDQAGFDAGAARVTGSEVRRRQASVRVRDTAVIMYTSGTTAAPKGAMLSHEAFCRFADASLVGRMRVGGDARVWTALPMFHIGGVGFALGTLYTGGTYVHVGFFDPAFALQQIRDEACNVALPGFETIWLPVIGHPNRADGDLDSLEVLMCVGVEQRLRQIQESTPNATMVSCFGQTEACAFLTLGDLDDPLDMRVTTGGFPLPGMDCEIRDPDTGEPLELPGTGELWYRGPQAFDGYFRDPELTEASFDDRRFFRTGDVVRMDAQGRVTFDSRVKDMLKVGGENVSAAEVEGYLLTHPAVEIAQVVAAPDEKYVEVPAAFIQLKAGATATEQELIDFARGKIATYRVPRYVRFVEEWPMSGTKVKKFVLREQIAKELADRGITTAPRITSSA
ncbi:AMP-binding protein [Candidatus Poriferisodalis sp.]|uniref:AMP-binding protein n=1 Tax=Candidatus Poriferisodalis sp. TaxID=3101277 RepID=UPI003B028A27